MSKSVYDMSLKELRKHYIKCQLKVWHYERKIDKSHYTTTYDPYGTISNFREKMEQWKRYGVNTAYELQRRKVWLIDPGRHNQTII